MEFSGCNINISQNKAFLIFWETKPSYISGNENPKNFLYFMK